MPLARWQPPGLLVVQHPSAYVRASNVVSSKGRRVRRGQFGSEQASSWVWRQEALHPLAPTANIPPPKPTAMNRQRLSQQVTRQPELPLFGFPLPALLSEVRRKFPSLASRRVEIQLHVQPTLATICPDGDSAVIRLHAVLNHPQTPPQVIAFILRHELLHLLVRPRMVDGKRTSHPPEFRKAERNFADRHGSWRVAS